jgi:signal transduction histidine kinase
VKLRTKLILFVVGVVIIPVLVSGLIGFYLHRRREWVPSPQRMGQMLGQFETEARSAVKGPDYASIEVPQGLTVWIVDSDNRVIYTNIEGTAVHQLLDPPFFERGLLLIHPITLQDSSEIRVLINFPPDPEGSGDKRRPIPFYARFLERSLWWLFAIIVFSAAMITIIVRSFNRSIRNLERATGRVADGDLDFELTARGNDEIASLTRSFDSMRRNLKDSIARRSRFLMGVSHDLKTPLTSIKGYLEAISDGLAENPEKLNRYLSVIGEKSKALEERIGELIDYVNMETGEWRMRQEEMDLSALLSEIAQMYREDASVFKRSFRYDIEPAGTVSVMGDRALLLRCFENLFDNAIRYTDEGDAIILSAHLKGDSLLVAFEDTGAGMDDDELNRVFEPFYRGTLSRREQGSGLGLSIVKSIIDAHGWRISVESTPKEKTVFTIYISPVRIF